MIELEDTTYGGRFFSDLSIERPRNAKDGSITGIEINLQQPFTSLPAPFDGFGASANYICTDSEATIFGRDDEVPFFLRPEHVANLALPSRPPPS